MTWFQVSLQLRNKEICLWYVIAFQVLLHTSPIIELQTPNKDYTPIHNLKLVCELHNASLAHLGFIICFSTLLHHLFFRFFGLHRLDSLQRKTSHGRGGTPQQGNP